MRTHTLRTNQLSRAAFDWYLNYLTVLDRKDLAAYGQLLADDVTLQMNNAEPTRGKAAVLEGLSHYWPSFGSIEHELLNLYGSDHSFVLEALNHYTRLDGSEVTLRAVAFTDRDESGRVTSVRLYTDTSPLWQKQAGTS